jgi:hypothetical protein
MIDQLKGKAAARITEQLFRKCVGLSRRGPQGAEEVQQPVRQVIECVVEPEPVAVKEPQPPNPATAFAEHWRKELTGIKPPANLFAGELFAAWQGSNLEQAEKIMLEKVQIVKMREEDRLKLNTFGDAIGDYLKEAKTA